MRLDQEEVFIFFVNVILVEKRFQVIRAMFDSFLKNPTEGFEFSSYLTNFCAIKKFESFSSALGVACEEGNSKTVEVLFISLIDVSAPQELIQMQKTLISSNSVLVPYFSFNILNKISEKFGVETVEEIFRSKFQSEDGSETDILNFALLNGDNLKELLRFVKSNSNFLNLCFCLPDKSGLNFVQRCLNSNSSKLKVTIFVELLEIIKSDKIEAKLISSNFQEHFENSSPENSLFFDALKVENVEAFKLIVEFVEGLEDSAKFFTKFLQFYLREFGDKFEVLEILLESLSLESVKNILNINSSLLLHSSKTQQENCLKFLKFLFDHFSDDSDFVAKHLFAQDEFGENFSFYYLNLQSTENQAKNYIESIRKLQEFVDLNTFEKLFLYSKKASNSQKLLNFEETQKIDFLDVLGLKVTKELVIRENQNVSQILDHDFIENFYRNVLNYVDGKTSPNPETSSFEQLNLEAFRQFSVEYNFQSFVRPDKEPIVFNQILLDLEILRETSDGFSFVNNRVVEVFGFARFYDILHETEEFKRIFIFPENIEIGSLARFFCLAGVVFASKRNFQNLKKTYEIKFDLVQESILGRNSNVLEKERPFTGSNLQKSLIIEFIDFLKVQFGAKFISKILTLKNSEGFTFWSHSISNRNISSLKELKFETFLEEILSKLCGNEIDFGNLNELALSLVFEQENLEKIDKKLFSKKYSKLFELEILTKLDDEVKFSDSSFLTYFAFKSFSDNLTKNFENEETAKFCSKLLSEKEKFSEICWLIEKFFEEKLIEGKISLNRFAEIGEENENLFFLSLEILLNRLKTEKDSKIVRNLFFERDGEFRRTFLHQFCRYSENWSENSIERLFKKLKEFKKYFPEKEFKDFLMIGDWTNWTFLVWLKEFKFFEIGFNFLFSEFKPDFVQDFLLIKNFYGNSLTCIKESITDFTQVINLFKNNFDKKFVKKFLMQKNIWDENFLLSRYLFDVYSDPENSSDLLKLFDLIFSIFGADLELFNDLFYSKSKGNETFFDRLTKNYKTKLNLITDWMKKNLGRNFLK
jgi:hypothetical protein